MSLKLYGDHASQPFRAVFVFCQINKLPYKFVQTRIGRGDHKKEQYLRINPAGKIPAIQHDGLCLAQSHAILRYLSRVYQTPQNWYPRNNLQQTAKIDEYLDFHHTGTRRTAYYIFNKLFAPKNNLPLSWNEQQAEKQVERNLRFINNVFLKSTPYLNSKQISIADLSAYQQLIPLRFIDYDFNKHPKIAQWLKRVELVKQIQDQNKIFNKMVSSFKNRQQKPKL